MRAVGIVCRSVAEKLRRSYVVDLSTWPSDSSGDRSPHSKMLKITWSGLPNKAQLYGPLQMPEHLRDSLSLGATQN